MRARYKMGGKDWGTKWTGSYNFSNLLTSELLIFKKYIPFGMPDKSIQKWSASGSMSNNTLPRRSASIMLPIFVAEETVIDSLAGFGKIETLVKGGCGTDKVGK